MNNKKGSLSGKDKDKVEQKMEEMGILSKDDVADISTDKDIEQSDIKKEDAIKEYDDEKSVRKNVSFDDIDDEDVDVSNRIVSDEEDAEGDYTEEEEEEIETEEEEEATEDENEGVGFDGEGRYMVIAGSFGNPTNAKSEAGRLSKKGYNQAEVVQFDRSDFHSVCVKRFFNEWEAKALVDDLKKKEIIAYVHKRRGKNVEE